MIKRIQCNPWPYAIAAYFALFITGMAGWITFAIHNDMELVRPDYYDHEIKYQEQLDRVARTAAIRKDVLLAYDPDKRAIAISLPKGHTVGQPTGEIHLYRPSDSKLDAKLPLVVSKEGTQTLNVAGLRGGLWRVRLSWTAAGSDYYFDQPLLLPAQ